MHSFCCTPPPPLQELDYEGSSEEFGLRLCEAMAALAPHFAAVTDPGRRQAYLEQMMALAQHPYLLLADRALPFWVKLLQVGGMCERGGKECVCVCFWGGKERERECVCVWGGRVKVLGGGDGDVCVCGGGVLMWMALCG